VPDDVEYADCTSADTTHPVVTTKCPSSKESCRLTVGIPRVSRPAAGVETIIEWLPVLEEIKTGTPPVGPFSLDPSVTPGLSASQRGLVAVRVNYPYQAAMLSSFRPDPDGPFESNTGNVNVADDVAVSGPGTSIGVPIVSDNEFVFGSRDTPAPFLSNTYAGKFGLGSHLAFGGKIVRPYRRVLAGQSIYRREVVQ
jgi:hypothetical protein